MNLQLQAAVRAALDNARYFSIRNPSWRIAKGKNFLPPEFPEPEFLTHLSIEATGFMSNELEQEGTVRVLRHERSGFLMVRVVINNPHFVEVELPDIQVFIRRNGLMVTARVLADGDLLAQMPFAVGTVGNSLGWAREVLQRGGYLDHLPTHKRYCLATMRNVHVIESLCADPFPSVDERFIWPLA